jgi:hypothetical protein
MPSEPTPIERLPVINGWTPPERIWLHDLGCGEVSWCEDPDPDGEQIEAVEYIRADALERAPLGPVGDDLAEAGANALRGFTVKDNEGWGWSMDKSERLAASRRVLTAALTPSGKASG